MGQTRNVCILGAQTIDVFREVLTQLRRAPLFYMWAILRFELRRTLVGVVRNGVK